MARNHLRLFSVLRSHPDFGHSYVAMPDQHEENLIRLLCAQSLATLGLIAAREMFGKAYFALGAHEKAAVDNAVSSMTWSNFAAMAPDYFLPPRTPAGFQPIASTTATTAPLAQDQNSQTRSSEDRS